MHCLVFPGRRDNDTCQHLDIQNPSGFTDTRTHAKDLCEISKRFPQRRAKYKRPVKWAISTHYISETLEIGAQLLRSYALYQMVLLTMTQTDQRLPKHFSPTFCVAFHVSVIGGGYKTYHQLRINCFALYKYTHYYFFIHQVVLFCSCSLAVLDPRVGHTMDVLSPFIPVLCHSD